MRILVLYAELMSYSEACIQEFLDRGYIVEVVHWEKRKLTPYVISIRSNNLTIYSRSNLMSILPSLVKKRWDFIVVSGWQDKFYLLVLLFHRLLYRTKVVSCFDDKWLGTKRQRLGALLFKYFGRLFYSHAWVAGTEQYTYARKFNFVPSRIATGLLFADASVFRVHDRVCNEFSSKRFLFAGRLEEIKGIDILISAWKELAPINWELHVVGSGSYSSLLESSDNLYYHGFKNSIELAEIMNECTVFIMPSKREPWGVVLHEAVLCGMPVICSNEVSSKELFIENFKNGLVIQPEQKDLVRAMKFFLRMPDDELISYSKHSLELATRVNSRTAINNLISVL